MLTGDTASERLASHTVIQNNNTTQKNMKKTLLIAAAALVAGVVTSEAQVYSANIVGYVNVVLPGNGGTALIANPLDDGNGNHLTNILSTALPGAAFGNGSKMFYYNGSSLVTVLKGTTGWASDVQLPPGTGFYVQNGKAGNNNPNITNTFVGSVVVNAGASVTNQIPAGYSLQGSTIPYAGNICVSGTSGGDANLNYGGALLGAGFGNGSTIIYLDPNNNYTPTTAVKNGSQVWGGTALMSVGQGFWINNKGTATNMVQTLP